MTSITDSVVKLEDDLKVRAFCPASILKGLDTVSLLLSVGSDLRHGIHATQRWERGKPAAQVAKVITPPDLLQIRVSEYNAVKSQLSQINRKATGR